MVVERNFGNGTRSMTPANDNTTDAAWARYCAEVLRLRLARLLRGRG